MSGDESVPPETTICLRTLKVLDCCCLEELVSVCNDNGLGVCLRLGEVASLEQS